MAIPLSALVQAAPFNEETRKNILSKIDAGTLSPDQEAQLIDLAWDMIIKTYQAQLSVMVENARDDEREGKVTYSPADFTAMQDKLIASYTEKLRVAEAQEQIDEVREKLQQIQTEQTKE